MFSFLRVLRFVMELVKAISFIAMEMKKGGNVEKVEPEVEPEKEAEVEPKKEAEVEPKEEPKIEQEVDEEYEARQKRLDELEELFMKQNEEYKNSKE